MRHNRFVELARPIDVLANLDWRLNFTGDLCVSLGVVIDDGLFEPVQAVIIKRMQS